MKTARTRVLAASATMALCLSPLAACGSETTTDDTTSGSSSGEHLTKENFAETVSEAMLEEKSGHMTMEMAGMTGEGDFEYSDDETVMQMSMSQGGQEMKMVLADGVMYMQAEGLSPKGKWVKVDKNTPVLGEMLGQMDDMSPAEQLKTLEKGLKSVKHVGESTLDGDEVQEYEVTVDPRVALEGTDVPADQVPASLTYTMFLTEDHLLRKMEMTMSGQTVEMEMTDWGKDVDVEIPPASQVVPFELPTS